jgi:hypothetical protein
MSDQQPYWHACYRPGDLRRDAAVAAMQTTYRLHPVADHGWGPRDNLQIWFRNEWHWVARTDLCDNVCTGIIEPQWTLDEWIAHYKNLCSKSYGARINDRYDGFKTFAVIDAMTDG